MVKYQRSLVTVNGVSMKHGLLIILSGPSGVGKGVLRKKLMKDNELGLTFSVSMTTREQRPKEINGKDYYFVSKEKFERLIANDGLIEHVEYCGNYYGTPKKPVEDALKRGENVLLEIEVQGAAEVMKHYRGMYTLAIFLMPPSVEELERRIMLRGSESEEEIDRRLAQSKEEMKLRDNYDVCLTNYTVKKTALRFTQAVKNRIKYCEAVEQGLPTDPNYIIKRP